MLVRDLMHPGLLTCRSTNRLGEVASLLCQHHVHALVVVDAADGRPIGLVADTDLLVGEWLATDSERQATIAAMTAGEIMSKPFLTIEAEANVAEAIAQMRTEHVAHLIVIDGDQPAGVISISDVVAAIADAAPKGNTVRDVMSWGIVVCSPGTPVRAAARAMSERRSRSIVVTDSNGRGVGIVTGFDLLAELTMPTQIVNGHTIDGFMHPPITIAQGATLQEAADLMLTREIHRLLVVDPTTPNGLPVGIISTIDIVSEMSRKGSAWR